MVAQGRNQPRRFLELAFLSLFGISAARRNSAAAITPVVPSLGAALGWPISRLRPTIAMKFWGPLPFDEIAPDPPRHAEVSAGFFALRR